MCIRDRYRSEADRTLRCRTDTQVDEAEEGGRHRGEGAEDARAEVRGQRREKTPPRIKVPGRVLLKLFQNLSEKSSSSSESYPR